MLSLMNLEDPSQNTKFTIPTWSLRKCASRIESPAMRFGLNGDPDPQSLEQIGRRLGLTRERVRQIETQALERLAVERELDALTAA